MYNNIKRIGASFLMASAVSFSVNSYAEDVEIYTTNADTSNAISNVLLMVDTSGSMTGAVPGTGMSRREHVGQALRDLVTGLPDDARVGIGRFNHPGASILHPVAKLSDNANSLVKKTILASANDAYESGADGSVVTDSSTLQFHSRLITKTFPIVSPTDDMEICGNGGNLRFDGALHVSYDGDGCGAGEATREYNGMLFKGIDIPRGSEIVNAHIELTAIEDSFGDVHASFFVEDTVNPEDYATIGSGGTALYDRSLVDWGTGTPTEVKWSPIETASAEDVLRTPSLGYVIQNLTNRSEWHPSDPSRNNISIIMRDSDGAPVTRTGFYSYDIDPAKAPRLVVTYEDTSQTFYRNKVGLRFSDLEIPSDINVAEAKLIFTAADDYGSNARIDIRIEDSVSTSEFAANTNDISNRPTETFSDSVVFATTLRSGVSYALDITNLMNNKLSDGSWDGSGDINFILESGNVDLMYGGEAGASFAPKFYLRYNTVSTSSVQNKYISSIISDGSDDAQSTLAGKMDLSSSFNYFAPGSRINGFIFRDIDLDAGSDVEIVDAYLEFTASNNVTDETSVKISRIDENAGTMGAFKNQKSYLQNLPLGSSVTWDTDNPWKAGAKHQSVSVKSLVEEALADPTWVRGGSIGFVTEALTGANKYVYTFNGSASRAPKLVIEAKVKSETNSVTVRDRLLQIIEGELPPDGWTPIPGSLYESYLYFSGNGVDFGRSRNANGSLKSKRLSADNTYINGSYSLPSGCDPSNLDSTKCYDEEILGNPRYISPIQEGECSKNSIILLTDGMPSASKPNSFNVKNGNLFSTEVQNLSGLACEDDHIECAVAIADFMANNDVNTSVSGAQTVETYVVGFADTNQLSNYKTVADAGKGEFRDAQIASELLEALNAIFDSVLDLNTTIVTPGVAVNNNNKFEHLNDLYFSVFKPDLRVSWKGNLKKYELGKTSEGYQTIVDSLGQPAVGTNGMFIGDTTSFWSTAPDGDDVKKGGAASKLDTDRIIYTYLSATAPNDTLLDDTHKMTVDNTAIDRAILEIDATETDDYVNTVRAWLSGVDVNDENLNGDMTDSRSIFGSPLHSRPILISFNDTESTVFVSTNEGYLHAIDSSTGKEVFSFMPQSMLKNAKLHYDNAKGSILYGLDSSWVALRNDANRDGQISGAGEYVYLYGGMRRGGYDYYALDVSNAKLSTRDGNVRYKFRITNESGTAFENKGQSWSIPIITRVNVAGVERVVLLFGGGYDPIHDDNNTNQSSDSFGNQVYMIDAYTGELIWWASDASSSANLKISDMNFSVPSKLSIVDLNNDGLTDHIYFGDMGGQIFRVDIDNEAADVANFATGKVIAKLGKTDPLRTTLGDRRRFYAEPSLAVMEEGGARFMAVAIGSGYMAHPLNIETEEKWFLIKDYEVMNQETPSYAISTAYTMDNLADVTELYDAPSANAALENKNGYYISLGQGVGEAGEKVNGQAVVFDGNILFTTYIPRATTTSCAPAAGISRQYEINVLNGTPIQDQNGGEADGKEDRYSKDVVEGLTSGVKVIYTEDGAVAISTTKVWELDESGHLGSRRMLWYKEHGSAIDDRFDEIDAMKVQVLEQP